MLVVLALVALVVGILMGATGIGGILLIPAMTVLAGLGTHAAMATTLFTQFFTAVVGVFLHHRFGSLDWSVAVPVGLGAILFGYLGALVNSITNAVILNLILSLIIIFAGVYTLRPIQRTKPFVFDKSSPAHRSMLLAIGAAVGFVSGLTGVGGPVLSVPLMVIIGFSPVVSIAASQAIQITAAASGTVGNLAYGTIDLVLAGWVTVLEVAGVILGIRIALQSNARQLRLAIALVCLVVGMLVGYRALKALP